MKGQDDINGVQPFNFPNAATLFDQTDNASGNGAPDQAFEAAYQAYDCEAADDFDVTDATGWDITAVNSLGSNLPAGSGPAAFINLWFYADNGGAPADTPECEYLLQSNFTDAAGDLSITLDSTCNLSPGTYWVAQQARQDFNPSGQHFYSNRAVQSGNTGLWRNPGDGFGTGCVSWSPSAVCIGGSGNPIGGGWPDYLFQIIGDVRPDAATAGGAPAIGPLGMLLTVLALGGGSGYVIARRRRG